MILLQRLAPLSAHLVPAAVVTEVRQGEPSPPLQLGGRLQSRLVTTLNADVAGRVRARPILPTSITTFLGVSPLLFFASALSLLTLPCFYLIGDDLREWSLERWRKWQQMFGNG